MPPFPDDGRCFLCDRRAEVQTQSLDRVDGRQFRCPTCGFYGITRMLAFELQSRPELFPALRIAVRRSSQGIGEPLVLDTKNYARLASAHARISLADKQRSLLDYLRRHSDGVYEEMVDVPDFNYPLFGCKSEAEFTAIVNLLQRKGLVSLHMGPLSLTEAGWEVTEPPFGCAVPRTCFVAMSFADPLNSAYDEGIAPAVQQDCGLTVVRVDRQESNQKIDDRILEGIHQAEVVVADCTVERGGIYFEAGFALALGRQVVFTCRADTFKDGAGVHFDTRMYPYLVWQDPADLREQLARRLRNTVPSLNGRAPSSRSTLAEQGV